MKSIENIISHQSYCKIFGLVFNIVRDSTFYKSFDDAYFTITSVVDDEVYRLKKDSIH